MGKWKSFEYDGMKLKIKVHPNGGVWKHRFENLKRPCLFVMAMGSEKDSISWKREKEFIKSLCNSGYCIYNTGWNILRDENEKMLRKILPEKIQEEIYLDWSSKYNG